MTPFHDSFGNMPTRDYACILLPTVDYEAQLQAMRSLLDQHKKNEDRRTADIQRIDQAIPHLSEEQGRWASDDRSDRLHASVYADAAHSMAAIGMLAPFIETIFNEAFSSARSFYGANTDSLPDHRRWKADIDLAWNCRHSWKKNGARFDSMDAGIMQLSSAIGLKEFLPTSLPTTLSAVFAYRNKMFHLGFEWPVHEREKFNERIAGEKWQTTWFQWATRDSKPWICYITNELIAECLTQIDGVLHAFGAFAVQKLPSPNNVEKWEPPLGTSSNTRLARSIPRISISMVDLHT
ncbi:hypothetical protein D0T23_26260 [Duganella sp. BJB475]|nr:hypothetical protein D0T23_26260 [Duganella sp. BJB475]RFP25448.1 hypothetical protein D0T21_28345 [Duganella sp. BJB476]